VRPSECSFSEFAMNFHLPAPWRGYKTSPFPTTTFWWSLLEIFGRLYRVQTSTREVPHSRSWFRCCGPMYRREALCKNASNGSPRGQSRLTKDRVLCSRGGGRGANGRRTYLQSPARRDYRAHIYSGQIFEAGGLPALRRCDSRPLSPARE
jgi:hypothetical protein